MQPNKANHEFKVHSGNLEDLYDDCALIVSKMTAERFFVIAIGAFVTGSWNVA